MKEKIIKKGPANWYHGFGSKGGKLVLTNKTLYFEGHMFNAGKKEFEVNVEDITGVEPGFLKNLTISTKHGEEKFAVNGKSEWVEAIEQAMSECE